METIASFEGTQRQQDRFHSRSRSTSSIESVHDLIRFNVLDFPSRSDLVNQFGGKVSRVPSQSVHIEGMLELVSAWLRSDSHLDPGGVIGHRRGCRAQGRRGVWTGGRRGLEDDNVLVGDEQIRVLGHHEGSQGLSRRHRKESQARRHQQQQER